MLVHDRSLVHRDDDFWSRRAIAQFTVRPLRIVMTPPLFDDDLSLLRREAFKENRTAALAEWRQLAA